MTMLYCVRSLFSLVVRVFFSKKGGIGTHMLHFVRCRIHDFFLFIKLQSEFRILTSNQMITFIFA